MQDGCIEQFINSFRTPPSAITLAIDTMDDPTHGQQQLTFFHGYYKQYQYLVRYVTCAENDMVVLPQLLFGDATAKLGAIDQLHTIITRFHQRFPDTRIHIRADSAFGGPEEYETLESLPNVTYTIGMKLNPKIKRMSEYHLMEAKAEQEKTQCSQLRFLSLEEYDSKQWSSVKTVVVKTEVTEFSSSQRAVTAAEPVAQNSASWRRLFRVTRWTESSRFTDFLWPLDVPRSHIAQAPCETTQGVRSANPF